MHKPTPMQVIYLTSSDPLQVIEEYCTVRFALFCVKTLDAIDAVVVGVWAKYLDGSVVVVVGIVTYHTVETKVETPCLVILSYLRRCIYSTEAQ